MQQGMCCKPTDLYSSWGVGSDIKWNVSGLGSSLQTLMVFQEQKPLQNTTEPHTVHRILNRQPYQINSGSKAVSFLLFLWLNLYCMMLLMPERSIVRTSALQPVPRAAQRSAKSKPAPHTADGQETGNSRAAPHNSCTFHLQRPH